MSKLRILPKVVFVTFGWVEGDPSLDYLIITHESQRLLDVNKTH